MQYEFTEAFARSADSKDELASFRNKFFIPQVNGEDSIYLTGNSLGLQPKSAIDHIKTELKDWADLGVEGHFAAQNPWFSYHHFIKGQAAKMIGAKDTEVTHMNSLTTNLHLLFVSLYRPNQERFKIICEAKAFPSDNYMLQSQVEHHGYKYNDAVVEVHPRQGEHCLRHEDILKAIEENKDQLALVFIGGVNYYTGQLFDMKDITAKAHAAGAIAGFDLAHAVGNVKLELHDWNVDFAAWCGYKYLNSGPGGLSGLYLHEKHATNKDLHRFAGWWGYTEDKRFLMEHGFEAIPTAEGWQLSNAPVMNMAIHKAALDIFDDAGMDRLTAKAAGLTGYMEYILDEISANYNVNFEIITPREQENRGCQLSVLTSAGGKELYEYISERGVIADWREPNVIRMAPVPLYNSYLDIYKLGALIVTYLKQK